MVFRCLRKSARRVEKFYFSSILVKIVWRRSSLHPKKPNLAGNRDRARLYFLLSSTFLWCCNFQISALERTLSGCLLSISIDFTPFPVKLISARTGIRMCTCRCISPNVKVVTTMTAQAQRQSWRKATTQLAAPGSSGIIGSILLLLACRLLVCFWPLAKCRSQEGKQVSFLRVNV